MKKYLTEDFISETILLHFAPFIKINAPDELQMLNDALLSTGLDGVGITINTVLWVFDNSDMNAELYLSNYIKDIIQHFVDELDRLRLLASPIPTSVYHSASNMILIAALRALY